MTKVALLQHQAMRITRIAENNGNDGQAECPDEGITMQEIADHRILTQELALFIVTYYIF
ncbi:hypothetical protein KJZ99_08260 [bacterium]|nr:hypothetical protein [bacterium]